MTTTDRCSNTLVDIPSTPEERLHELAAILAAGILRLQASPPLVSDSENSGANSASEKSLKSRQYPLAFPRT